MLRAQDLSVGYGRDLVLRDVSLDVLEGSFLGLVGPNGAGKSTLLRCLYGAIRPRAGEVWLDEREIHRWTRKQIAREIGVVPQRCDTAFRVTVEHFVGVGRFAHEHWLRGPSRVDRAVVRRCLDTMHVASLATRPIDELSGGELRRVIVAQALAQEARILLLDEPVQQLDLLHQLEVMEFLRSFARRGGTATVAVLHDLGLAARYCDRIALLHRGRIVATGAPEVVLTQDTLLRVWGVRASIERSPATGTIHVIPIAAATAERAHTVANESEDRK